LHAFTLFELALRGVKQINCQGLSRKDVRTQGGGFAQIGHFLDKRGRRVLQMRTSALFRAKNFSFGLVYCYK